MFPSIQALGQFGDIFKHVAVRLKLAYETRNYPQYAALFNDSMGLYHKLESARPDAAAKAGISDFMGVLLSTFVGEKFQLEAYDAARFIDFNPMIANLLAASKHETADRWLDQLLDADGQIAEPFEHNFLKVLVLLSSRIRRRVNFDILHEGDREAVALWWSAYTRGVSNTAEDYINENLTRCFRWGPPPAFPQDTRVTNAAFLASYKDLPGSRKLKQRVNEHIQKRWPQLEVTNNPDPKRIAVITNSWQNRHVIYRTMGPLVKALHGQYRMDLFQGQPHDPDKQDTTIFENVYELSTDKKDPLQNLGPLLNNQYGAVMYVDIGMSNLSVILSNQRFAPIQMALMGHPVSTFGGKIDYFISGDLGENLNMAEVNYSERLVLLPGLGIQATQPAYELQRPKRDETIVINACWSGAKFNRPMLEAVRDAMDNAKRKSRVHFFPNDGINRYFGFSAFENSTKSIMGDRAVIMETAGGRPAYMHRLERGDFGIDSYPFCGFNTIFDLLHVQNPVVTFQGGQWHNRASSAIIDVMGMGELITTNYDTYRDLITRMIDDDDFRTKMVARIKQDVLRDAFYTDTTEQVAFKTAVQYLIEQQPNPNTISPIYIRGASPCHI